MRKVGTVVDINALIQRASATPPGDDSGFRARQAEILRTEHLRRADPEILRKDIDAIRLDRLYETKHLTAVKHWWDRSDVPVLCLGGSKGTGKTVAGCWAIAEAGGHYVTATELARMAMSFRREDEWNSVSRGRVLVLDDLATELCTPAQMEPVLLQLVNRRLARDRRTIITTNQSVEQLKQRYPDDRLWSRLVRSWAYVKFDGPDMRAQRPR